MTKCTEALRLLVEQFWLALGHQQEWLEEPQKVDDCVYKMQTQPGFIFDDTFWATFHGFAFKICHVAYYGPERLEDGDRRQDGGVFELRFALADKDVSCDAEKAVLVEAIEKAIVEIGSTGDKATEWAAVRTLNRALAATSPAAAAELCHLKDCGREAVVGTMKVWGPEYRVALCEHHVMEKLRAAAALLAQGEALKGALFKYGGHVRGANGCSRIQHLGIPCDCGWLEARAALAPGETE